MSILFPHSIRSVLQRSSVVRQKAMLLLRISLVIVSSLAASRCRGSPASAPTPAPTPPARPASRGNGDINSAGTGQTPDLFSDPQAWLAAMAATSAGTLWLANRKAAYDAGLWPRRKERYWWERLPYDAAFPISGRDLYVVRYNAILANDVNPEGASGVPPAPHPWQKFVQCTNRLVSEVKGSAWSFTTYVSLFKLIFLLHVPLINDE